MEDIKIGSLISNYEFTVGLMKIIPNKTVDNFISILQLFQKIKTTMVKKSSVRLIIDKSEYTFIIKQYEGFDELLDNDELIEDDFEINDDSEKITEPQITNEYHQEREDMTLSSNIIKNIIISHYKSVIINQ